MSGRKEPFFFKDPKDLYDYIKEPKVKMTFAELRASVQKRRIDYDKAHPCRRHLTSYELKMREEARKAQFAAMYRIRMAKLGKECRPYKPKRRRTRLEIYGCIS